MAATSAQIESVFDITGEYSLITGAVTLTDNSAWGSIGIVTPDTAKILLQIYDSTGALFYENAGWNSGSYASPDMSLLDTTYTFTLPTDVAGDYLTGQFLIKGKVQVVEDGETTVVSKNFYQNVSPVCNDITISVEGGVIAGTTEVNLVDNTNYKTYTALSRVMILYPPPPSGQASQTGTNVDVIVYSGTVYTGTWTWKLTSDITYTDVDGTSTTCRITKQGTFHVEQSQLCKVLCLVEKYRNQTLIPALSNKNSDILLKNYLLAMSEFQLARDGYICGKSQTVIDSHIDKVYTLLGIDPDCDCGCDDGTSQPLLSVTTVDGTDGTDGSQILFGSGAPAGGTGAVGDVYINTANGDMYKKTGASTWTFQLNINGADGTTPVAMIHNDITDSTTATNALETLKTFTMDAGQMATDGDLIHVRAAFRMASKNSSAIANVAAIYLDSALIGSWGIYPNNTSVILDAYITRTAATTGKDEYTITTLASGLATAFLRSGINAVAVSGWANALDIEIKANDNSGNAITCELFQVTYFNAA